MDKPENVKLILPIEDADDMSGTDRPHRGTGRRFRGAIVNKMGVAILSGEYQPGDRMRGEIESAEALDVSRSAYREAVQILTAKGLVESRPKAGTRILPRDRWNILDPEVLAWAFAGEPSAEFVRDLFELRAVVEPAAAKLAAERRRKEHLKCMKDALGIMRRDTLARETGRAADRDFHDAILRATGNGAILALSASIGAAVKWTTQFKLRSRALPRDPIPDHVRVYEAIAAGNVEEAGKAMRNLVDLALEDTSWAMGGDSGKHAPQRAKASN
jgi:DNA-binding FadR family transcriptional regulator